MVESIESFVAKLQADGVQAGQQAAAKIRTQAEAEARQIIHQAKAQAQKILAEADQQAQATLAHVREELKLAVRDAVARLRECLKAALRTVLANAAKEPLSDPAFLAKLLHELVLLYAQADAAGQRTIQVNLPPESHRQLVDWALHELGKSLAAEGHRGVQLQKTLSQAGFEIKTDEGTVEVTTDSVVEVLSELVSPALRKVVADAAADTST